MDNVLIVVDDLEAAKAFFAELGMELEGETQLEGPWVDRTVGLNDVRADIAMMRTPDDSSSRLELTKFHTPPAVRAGPENAPANRTHSHSGSPAGSLPNRYSTPRFRRRAAGATSKFCSPNSG